MKKWHFIIYAPAYNVGKTIKQFLGRIKRNVKKLEKRGVVTIAVIIVNDGSSDDTLKIIKSIKKTIPFLRIVNKRKNEGVVTALLDGMKEINKIIGQQNLIGGGTIILRMDSDLEHRPEDIEKLIEPIMTGKAKISVGYTKFGRKQDIAFKLFNEFIGSKDGLEFLGIKIPQFWPGFIAIRADLFNKIYPTIVKKAYNFKKMSSMDFLALDFFTLILAKRLNEKIAVIEVSPVEREFIKKVALTKILYYLNQRRKTLDLLRKNKI